MRASLGFVWLTSAGFRLRGVGFETEGLGSFGFRFCFKASGLKSGVGFRV